MKLRHLSAALFGLLPVLLLLAAALASTATADLTAATRYVAPNGGDLAAAGPNACLDAALPCATIRHAIGQSAAGDAIRLAPGTYREAGLVVPHALSLSGEAAAAVTLDGQGAGGVLVVAPGAALTLDGLTVRGGAAERGGAVRVESGGALLVRAAALRDNRADLGGGIYAAGGRVTIEDSELSGNSAGAGGAIYLDSSELALQRSAVRDNRAGAGAGIYIGPQASAAVGRATLAGNIANATGGALHLMGRLSITNSVLADNTAGARGGGLFSDGGSADIDYTTWLRNGAAAGEAIAVGPAGGARLRNSVLAGGNLCAGPVDAGGNLADDGSCGQPAQPATALDTDGRPAPGSNAIDAGPAGLCTAFGGALAADLRGEARPADGDRDGAARCDTGAYEFQPRLTIINSTRLADGTQFDYSGDLGRFALDSAARTRLIMEAAPGVYRVEQVNEPRWKLNDISCAGDTDGGSVIDVPGRAAAIDLDAGETITCTYNSRPNKETAGVAVLAPDGGAPVVAFSGDLGAFTLQPGANPDFRSARLAPGVYSVSAAPPAGWRVADIRCAGDDDGGNVTNAAAGTATIDLDANETQGCIFTLARSGATSLTIRHQVTPADDQPFTYTGDLGAFNLRAVSAAASSFSPTPGSYRVRALLHPRWRPAHLSCSGDDDGGSVLAPEAGEAVIDLDAGEAITCTFSYARLAAGTGTITIAQQAADAGGASFPFSGSLGNFSLSPPAAASRAFIGLRPSVYNVQSAAPAGWVLEGISCIGDNDNGSSMLPDEGLARIDLDEGEVITCTFVAARPSGEAAITVIHEALPADQTLFRYNGDLGGFSLRVPNRPSRSFIDLQPGVYYVGARKFDGWTVHDITCEGDADGGNIYNVVDRHVLVDLDLGEAVVCRFLHLADGVQPPTPTPTPPPTPSPTPPPGGYGLFLPVVVR